jgi:hypothetical protein
MKAYWTAERKGSKLTVKADAAPPSGKRRAKTAAEKKAKAGKKGE